MKRPEFYVSVSIYHFKTVCCLESHKVIDGKVISINNISEIQYANNVNIKLMFYY